MLHYTENVYASSAPAMTYSKFVLLINLIITIETTKYTCRVSVQAWNKFQGD